MGNHIICGGAPQHCVDECARLQMETRSREADDPECDPAGTVFDETLQGLARIDQEALRFAGTSNLSALRWLLAMGASVRARDRNSTTLLHAACRCGSYSVVQELLQQELLQQALPVDAADSAGWTPLHISAVMGRRDIALLLLRLRASVATKNRKGVTPLGLCSDPGTKEVLERFGAEGNAAFPAPLPTADLLRRGALTSPCQAEAALTTCEPFFVPRIPLFHDEAHRAELMSVGLEVLNLGVGHGLAFLVAAGLVHDHPSDLSKLLAEHSVDPVELGKFLSEEFSLAQTVRLAFIYSADLTGTGIVGALVKVFKRLRAPPDLVKLERLTSAIADLWWRTHDAEGWDELDDAENDNDLEWSLFHEDLGGLPHGEGPQLGSEIGGMRLRRHISSTEGLRRVMFSAVMLYWSLHGASCRQALPGAVSPRKLSLSSWLDMNAGIEADGSNLPVQVQRGVYQLLAGGGLPEFLPGVEGAAGDGADVLPALAGSGPAGWASVPHGGLERYQPALFSAGQDAHLGSCALSESTGAPSRPPAPSEVQRASQQGEAVWLTQRGSLLLFLASGPQAVPYAFIRLEDAVVRDVSRESCQLILSGRPREPSASSSATSRQSPPRTPFGDSARLPLPLCFLLADGRFQPFEALWLELQFSAPEEFDIWAKSLETVRDRPSSAKGDGAALNSGAVADSTRGPQRAG